MLIAVISDINEIIQPKASLIKHAFLLYFCQFECMDSVRCKQKCQPLTSSNPHSINSTTDQPMSTSSEKLVKVAR